MSCHILLIEDEPDIRETLRELLELVGFKVETAANGREGLDKLESAGRPCLILLDLMMPVMNGWEFLDALQKSPDPDRAAIPVIAVSAAVEMVDLKARYGCRSLKKPVDIDTLLNMVREHCDVRS
ncbi:MAG: hypothetical protein JWP79_185 [Polaromonas sp.]|jgi:CheY-like chemotaxis protein|nr:hypothetical protein [Polaromonas sp.]MDB5842875.1 hypothetical protein [Polaromonas sp.]MDB5938706.1 hypothetical protein [Polaromonas sp.]